MVKITLDCRPNEPDDHLRIKVNAQGHNFEFWEVADGYKAMCSCGLDEFRADQSYRQPKLVLDALHGSLLLLGVGKAFEQHVCCPALLSFFEELAINSIAWADTAVAEAQRFLKKQGGALHASDLRNILKARSQF